MAVTRLIFVDSASNNVFVNQGIELALAESVKPGELALYLWTNDHTVVIGRNQNARAECRVDALEADGGLLARRLSGGGAVWHDLGNLNFTFAAKACDYDKEVDFDIVVAALDRIGIKAERSGRNDLTVGGAKFGGNAYYSHGDIRFHHGTLLLTTSPDAVAKYLTPPPSKFVGKAVSSVRSRVTALSAIVPDITREAVVSALKDSLAAAYPAAQLDVVQPFDIGAAELMKNVAFFADDEWRYGKKEDYSHAIQTEAFGEGVTVRVRLDGGVLAAVAVDSDSLFEEKFRALGRVLEGADLYGGEVEKKPLDEFELDCDTVEKTYAEAARVMGELKTCLEEDENV